MAKIIITSEGQFVREVELVKERVTIGRKPHNDVTLDDRAVSSQHATISLMLDDAILEDLDSTNGTLIMGEKITRRTLKDGDKITIAHFVLEYLATPPKLAPSGFVEVLNGAHAGKKIQLTKPLTTVGKPGASVVAITCSGGAFSASRIDGELGPTVNGGVLGDASLRLSHGDVIDLGGTRMVFMSN
ncbi:FHA domain-containing protein [Massilia sp. TSP1-1-2]|uniref:FHA domain-containing protein n=1 Tax=unclassified Massilia TaxID=2609279 RepID=UPI003CEAF1FB